MRRSLRMLPALLCAVSVSHAAVRYVNHAAAGSGDGTSWANAYRYLQDALAAAAGGDSIWVAAGTYYPDQGAGRTDNSVSSTFMCRDSVVILGGFATSDTVAAQRNWTTRVTTLSGAIDGNTDTVGNAHSVVSFVDAGSHAVLDGFTITGGIGGSGTSSGGGGIYCSSSGDSHVSSPRIANCTVNLNAAEYGGGMLIYSRARGTSSPTLVNCTFSANHSWFGDGGGVHTRADTGTCRPAFTMCTFSGNNATEGEGGGMCNRTKVMLDSCTFSGNRAYLDGGGLRCSDSVTLAGCTFSSNRAGANGGLGRGGAMYTTANATLNNCTMTGNSAEGGGGGLSSSGTPVLTGCTISGNRAAGDGGGIQCSGRITLTDCTISRNSAPNGNGGGMDNSGTATLTGCTFSEDSASDWYGGGICNTSSLTLTNCTVTANHAWEGGGVYTGGAGATFTGCTFRGNSAGDGGGMYNSGNPRLTSCTLIGNRATGSGGGIYNTNDPTLTNCTISWNRATGDGGGMFNDAYNYYPSNYGTMHPRLVSCVVTGNSAASGGGICNSAGRYDDETGKIAAALINCTLTGNGGGIYNRATGNLYGDTNVCVDTLTNCILWADGGTNAEISNSSARCLVSRCCVRGSSGSGGWNRAYGTDRGGNIDADPRFVARLSSLDSTGDLRLERFSPCIDAADGSRAPTLDMLGQSRFDDLGVTNTGAGTPPYADMGAYERQILSSNAPPVLASVNDTAIQPGSPWQVQLSATDADGDTVSFVVRQGPSAMQLDARTGLLSWTPAVGDTGAHTITVAAIDGHGGIDSTSFTVAVGTGSGVVHPSSSVARSRSSSFTLTLYNGLGVRVFEREFHQQPRVPRDSRQLTGQWRSADPDGPSLPAGIYLARVRGVDAAGQPVRLQMVVGIRD